MAISGIEGTNNPYIIVQSSNSINGVTVPAKSYNIFGTVKIVYNGCEFFGVGDSVFFDSSKAVRFFKSSINYFVVDKQYIFFTETSAS